MAARVEHLDAGINLRLAYPRSVTMFEEHSVQSGCPPVRLARHLDHDVVMIGRLDYEHRREGVPEEWSVERCDSDELLPQLLIDADGNRYDHASAVEAPHIASVDVLSGNEVGTEIGLSPHVERFGWTRLVLVIVWGQRTDGGIGDQQGVTEHGAPNISQLVGALRFLATFLRIDPPSGFQCLEGRRAVSGLWPRSRRRSFARHNSPLRGLFLHSSSFSGQGSGAESLLASSCW
ncbi:hypothetical protein ACIHDR_26275 [Nocardia sp. NPDC052278]|uniref:hypothetical protein n=1 Tax=unclassified Nocardia TaxID=2637762 RepID=UPI0036BC62D6